MDFTESTNPKSPHYRTNTYPPRNALVASPYLDRPRPPLPENAYFSRLPIDMIYNVADNYFKNLLKEYSSDQLNIVYDVMSEFKLAFGRDFDLHRYQLKKYGPINSIRYIKDESYRNQEIRGINRIPWFISLDLSYPRGFYKQPDVDENEKEICNFLENNECYAVNLSNRPLRKLNSIRYINDLDLSGTLISNVSMLGGVKILNLSRCNRVSDVSALGRVHALNLTHTSVLDVSALGRVNTLKLSTTHVENVSALGGVYSLNLSDTLVRDVSALGRVHILNLESCENLEDVSALGGVQYLNVHNCMNLYDVDPIRDVRCIAEGCNGDRCRFLKRFTR
jgi:hypothetical protein